MSSAVDDADKRPRNYLVGYFADNQINLDWLKNLF